LRVEDEREARKRSRACILLHGLWVGHDLFADYPILPESVGDRNIVTQHSEACLMDFFHIYKRIYVYKCGFESSED